MISIIIFSFEFISQFPRKQKDYFFFTQLVFKSIGFKIGR